MVTTGQRATFSDSHQLLSKIDVRRTSRTGFPSSAAGTIAFCMKVLCCGARRIHHCRPPITNGLSSEVQRTLFLTEVHETSPCQVVNLKRDVPSSRSDSYGSRVASFVCSGVSIDREAAGTGRQIRAADHPVEMPAIAAQGIRALRGSVWQWVRDGTSCGTKATNDGLRLDNVKRRDTDLMTS